MRVKIGDKGFPTTHHGYLIAGSVVELPDAFGRYVVERMRAGEIVKPKRGRPRKNGPAE